MIKKLSIVLGCAPGLPRPGDFIGAVVDGTILAGTDAANPDNTVSRSFGDWTWEFDVPLDVWERDIEPVIKRRIVALYKNGSIRCGAWR